MHALFGRGTGDEGHEAPPAKNRPHEGVVEFSPVVVHSVRRGRKKHAQAGRAGPAVASKIRFRVVPVGKKWHGEGLGSRWFGGEHAAK